MKKTIKKIISPPGHEFERNVAESFNELYNFVQILGDEHARLINTNSILLHSIKAMKSILMSQSLMIETDFETAYNNALVQTKDMRISQSLSNEQVYYDFIIENIPPAHS
jgi:hypothetical protein